MFSQEVDVWNIVAVLSFQTSHLFYTLEHETELQHFTLRFNRNVFTLRIPQKEGIKDERMPIDRMEDRVKMQDNNGTVLCTNPHQLCRHNFTLKKPISNVS